MRVRVVRLYNRKDFTQYGKGGFRFSFVSSVYTVSSIKQW